MSNQNRLPAETKPGGFTRCCISLEFTRAIQWHHTIPQALGGEDSLQIPLDADSHSTLHSKADAVVAFLKGNRKNPIGNYWDCEEKERRADPWLKILVEAMLDPPVETDEKLIRLGAPKVDVFTRAQLDLLKRDLPGVTNLMQVQNYCIQFTLQSKGYKDGKTNRQSASSSGNNNRTSNLWSVCGTKRRKFDKR